MALLDLICCAALITVKRSNLGKPENVINLLDTDNFLLGWVMIALAWAIGLLNEISSYPLKKCFDVSFSMRETKPTDTP